MHSIEREDSSMRYIYDKELQLLLKTQEYDFVAYLMTPWHVHSFEAILNYLNDIMGHTLKGIVLILKSIDKGYIIDEQLFSVKNIKIFYYNNKKTVFNHVLESFNSIRVYNSLSKYKKREQTFYFMRPNGYTYKNLAFLYKVITKKISVIELDEGIGTYTKKEKDWLKSIVKETKSIKEIIRVSLKYIESKILKKSKIKKEGLYFDGRLLTKSLNDEYEPNYKLVEYYKESIGNCTKNKYIDVSCFSGNYVIVNTQPNTKNYLKNLEECVAFLQKRGYKIIIKIHPRELNEYDFLSNKDVIIYKCNFSQESILSQVKELPKFIIGYYSTTLVTANIIFDVKTYSLNDMVIDKVDMVEKEVMMNFKDSFSRYVYFASSFKDII